MYVQEAFSVIMRIKRIVTDNHYMNVFRLRKLSNAGIECFRRAQEFDFNHNRVFFTIIIHNNQSLKMTQRLTILAY